MSLTQYSDTSLLKMMDCQGFMVNGECSYLSIPHCIGKSCGYYHQLNTIEKAYQRLRSLDEATQERIAQKYYRGSRPWQEIVIE